MAKKKSSKPIDGSLEETLADSLNSLFEGQKVAYTLDELDAPTHVSDWISTGDSILDIKISNRRYGGVPVGRITEITGLEQSGKSLVSAHLLANTQKKGGVAVLIDTEMAVSREFFRAIGVDTKNLILVNADTVEEIFSYIENTIEQIRSTVDNSRFVTIVVDSVAAASTEQELASDYGKDGYATGKAIIISKALRKITNMIGRQRITLVFTNQLRMKMNAPAFADPYTTSGGKGLQFHSSVRLRLKKKAKLKTKIKGNDVVSGIKVQAVVVKNRLGPPEGFCDFEINFNSGIDEYASWLKVIKDYKIVKKKGSYSVYDHIDKDTGEVLESWQFQTDDFKARMKSDPIIRDAIYNEICDEMIMKYDEGDAEGEASELELA